MLRLSVFLVTIMLSSIASTQGYGASKADYARVPVLFVHGHGLGPGTWKELIAYLVNSGYPREYLYAIEIVPDKMANVPAATKVIAPAVTRLLANARRGANKADYKGEPPMRVDIVSHSMGAVSSRWYAVKLHPERVRTWIGLAGANHGTNALCNHTDDGARDLCPAFAHSATRNPVQVTLNGTRAAPIDETPYGLGVDDKQVRRIPPAADRNIVYFTIRIEPDRWIKPERSALLDGAGGVSVDIPAGLPVRETRAGNFLMQGKLKHDPFPRYRDVHVLVAALLAARD
ncbi:MAG: esterase/lipase family protein [Acidiferrobacterales bacterium]